MSDDDKPRLSDMIGLMPGLAESLRENIIPGREGVLCAHCGFQLRGSASVGDDPVCHPDNPIWPDCYQLVTVMHEPLGCRLTRTETVDGVPVVVGAVLPVSRAMLLDAGAIEPTPDERLEMDRQAAEYQAKLKAALPVLEAAVGALAEIREPLVRRLLEAHASNDWGDCAECGNPDDTVDWPCRTVLLIADHYRITFPPGWSL